MQIDKRKVRAAYLNKLKDSWQKYNSWLENASSPVLIERCREIAAVRACYDALSKRPASKEEMLYLLRFRDPLMAVKHVYLTMQEDVLAEDVFEVVSVMQDVPDTDSHFALDEEWAERDDPELRKAFREKVERCWNWFCDDIQDCTPLELLNRARKLEAARTSYILLKKPALPLECIQYLIRFKDPLRVTYEEWLADSRNAPYDCILEEIYDAMEGSEPAEQRYELEDGVL